MDAVGKNLLTLWQKPSAILAACSFFLLYEILLLLKFFQIVSASHGVLFMGYVVLTSLFLLSRPLIALFYHDRHGARLQRPYPNITFIIAAKNEAGSIYKTIQTCVESRYPAKIECIAIDDGSTDGTLAEMRRAAEHFSAGRTTVEIVAFETNKGKREAMAAGIHRSKNELIVFVDSDSFVEPEAVCLLAEHFMRDARVGAMSGNTLVENDSINTLTRMQAARYGVSFDIFKACESVFGVVTCCPGCFSAYRRSAVLPVIDIWKNRKVLGVPGTFGDDRSLTNAILQSGWRVEYCRAARASTIVPEEYRKFVKQQLRWKKSWVREGLFGAVAFMWRKNPVASLAYYSNLFIPLLGPFLVLNGLFYNFIIGDYVSMLLFLIGIIAMSFAFGLYHFAMVSGRYWYHTISFSLFYTLVLVWQMPWAIVRFTDGRWGTR